MNGYTFSYLIAWAGLIIGLVGILLRLKEIMARPFKRDLARPRGAAWRGVLYAFTLGMAPWEKESTRLHWIAYVRGILLPLGIIAAFGVFLTVPWGAGPSWGGVHPNAPTILGMGVGVLMIISALFGFSGIGIRWLGKNERALSTPDDYASVFLTSLFILLGGASLIWAAWLPVFFAVTALVGVYIPFSKIRHCAYFFYAKFFFGRHFGQRGVLGQPGGR